MAYITGETTTDYFEILCEDCNGQTENRYLGGDSGVPRIEVKCKKCGTTHKWKLNARYWRGLPDKVEKNETE